MNNIIRLTTTPSTNKEAMALAAKGAVHGTSVIAQVQTSGRGRLGKSWQSPEGKGLYCSVIVRPCIEPALYPYLTFVAGLAVAEVLEKKYALTVGLKWPNDIFIKMKKCGGILTESSGLSESAEKRFAVIGIGLNVNTQHDEFAKEVRNTATSLLIEAGYTSDIEKLFWNILTSLLAKVDWFSKEGILPVIDQWRRYDCLLGKKLNWVSVTGEIVSGVSLGPDDFGRLHVRDEGGQVHEVISGDIQLAHGKGTRKR